MYNLIGEYRVKIDSKGRIKLPKDLLRQLNSETALPLVVNRGYEEHLMLYPKDVWEKKTKELNSKLRITRRNERNAMKYFYRGASMLSLDNIERILIPKVLLQYAELKKDVVLFAFGEQIEIWDAEAYEKVLENEPDNFDEILEKLEEEKKAEKSDNHD